MKLSLVFAHVLAHLWDGKEGGAAHTPYICDTLDSLGGDGVITEEDKYRAKKVIHDLLGSAYSLREWLCENGHISAPEYDAIWHSRAHKGTPAIVKLQATRKAWLEHLIQHYAALGD